MDTQTLKARLLRDLYRWEGGVRLVFARKGDIVDVGPRSKTVDWLCGVYTARLVAPLDNGRIQHLGEGDDFEYLPAATDKAASEAPAKP
jgi:hypothetical protein